VGEGVPAWLRKRLRPDTQAARRQPAARPFVDDEPNIAELLAMALRYKGWDVAQAGTGTGGCGGP
jgi:two-component system, OmpR family, response regulator